MSDGMEGTGEQVEKEMSGVVLIYMFIAPRQGGDSAGLWGSTDMSNYQTLLFPQQRSLTAQHANTDRQTHTHSCEPAVLAGRMSWLVYCGLLVSIRVICHMAGIESAVL